MAPAEDQCALCHKSIFGKQMVLACFSCKKRFHLKSCLKLNQIDYELYMEKGESTYKCQLCIRKTGEATTETSTNGKKGRYLRSNNTTNSSHEYNEESENENVFINGSRSDFDCVHS
jgi:hypothetical protein